MIDIVHSINKKIQETQIDKWEKQKWKPIDKKWLDFFAKQNRQLFICNLISASSDSISNIIGKAQGGMSHTVLIYNQPKIETILSYDEQESLQSALDFYYQDPPRIRNIKLWIWGSADITGMNWFDFSKYQNRKKWIYALSLPERVVNGVIKKALKYIGDPYDVTGLVTWLLYKYVSEMFKCFDDDKSPYCSEFVYDILREVAGYFCAYEKDPSPYQIHKKEILNAIIKPGDQI